MSGIFDDKGRLRAVQGRPWSLQEIEQAIPMVMQRIEDGITELKAMGEREAQLKWGYERHAAIARRRTRGTLEGRTAKDDRDGEALLYVFTADDQADVHDPTFTGLALADVGLAKDLASNAYDDQRTILRLHETDLRVLQTLHVSGRNSLAEQDGKHQGSGR